ncbi:hypothetical protein [Aestuariibaculum sediminum]|uniref:Uncharacterized protein n=1 Tax=Aestuariibaculum sediminum TaxID=2770637 RepID=A0A8J6QLA3_9FLAO|nr:hypothetical protein [Aestuariibaculum sediminum]MBD0833349.1 hypothetical protein [Aestuariibaculum sediminum]
MEAEQIKAIIYGEEPIAILKYFEWPIFSGDYTESKYKLLRISKKNDIEEIRIPFNIVPFVMSKLDCFEEASNTRSGVVWERGQFKQKVKRLVSTPKINQFINQK